ncbi:hypothetical protein SCHPADRAFT_994695 [Schizopora paradoxa]|uniref:Myb-like domain-containing protein n=1 Tax=Schizopora paradoxa TaxID=27342 RepID=A0A0H2RZ97_9AGAM|nr:hypothetical protein SCHPADRAFT_994695 [Schizopora paradoxa]
MSYFTPPPSGNWNGSMPFGQNHGANGQVHHHHNPQFSQHQQPQQAMPNPMLMMMTMYQQMQNVAPPASRSQLPTPATEAQKPFVPMDEHKLAQVLFQQTTSGVTYKAAIETMHGFDGYAAYAWKDFYLEHKQKVDRIVDDYKAHAIRPSVRLEERPNDVKRELSASVSLSAKEEQQQQRKKSKEGSNPPKASKEKDKGKVKSRAREEVSISSASRRKTFNSLSVTPADNLLALVPPGVAIDAHTGLPAAPSKRPTAPTSVISKGFRGRGNAYTEEDTAFFYQLAAWELANNPNATKGSICELLSELAPHHSALSWRTFWGRHEDVADKMLMLSELSDVDREERIRAWKNDGTTAAASTASGRATKKVSYAESSSESEVEEIAESDSHENDSSDDDAEDDEDEDAIGSTDDEENALGTSGTLFTAAEMRVLAKHIASVPGWFKGQKDWSGFVDKYSQRTAASWREYYRRRQKEVDEAARKYMKRAKRAAESNSVHQQRGRPSWASTGSGRPPSSEERSHKRKHPNEQSENGQKRARSDDTE